MDPRFAVADPKPTAAELPGTLYHHGSNGQPLFDAGNSSSGLTAEGSHESTPGMARASAVSETSHYSTVSHGGVHPDWQPPAATAAGAAGAGSFAGNAGRADMHGSALSHIATTAGGSRDYDAYAGPYGPASATGG